MFIYRCTLNIHMFSGPNYWCVQISLRTSLTMTASSNFTLQVRVTKPHLLQPTISALSMRVDKRHQAYSVHCGHHPLGNHEEWVHTVSKPNLFNSAGVCLHRTANMLPAPDEWEAVPKGAQTMEPDWPPRQRIWEVVANAVTWFRWEVEDVVTWSSRCMSGERSICWLLESLQPLAAPDISTR